MKGVNVEIMGQSLVVASDGGDEWARSLAATVDEKIRDIRASGQSVNSINLAILAALTATFGNLAAYAQTNLKRLLAYSTIAHAGYMLMGLATFTKDGVSAGGAGCGRCRSEGGSCLHEADRRSLQPVGRAGAANRNGVTHDTADRRPGVRG